jgi:hypothetical protein
MEPLAADDLERLAIAAHMVGEDAVSVANRKRAHHKHCGRLPYSSTLTVGRLDPCPVQHGADRTAKTKHPGIEGCTGREIGPGSLTAIGYRSSAALKPVSSRFLIVVRNRAASAPSMIRWS